MGSALIAAAVGLCVAFLWMLPLLALLLPGPLAFAITAAELRIEPPSGTDSAG
jgi:CBS-domain-containing membrane protein